MKKPDSCSWASSHLKNQPLQAQLFRSNYVFEFWSYHAMIYTWIMQFLIPFRLMVSDSNSEQYSLIRCWKPAIWVWFRALFHCNSMNIDHIATWRPSRERPLETASFTYRSCRDMLRMRKLICSQNCRNCIMERGSSSNMAKNPRFQVGFRLEPGAGYPVLLFCGS